MAATNDRGLRNAESTQRLRSLVARLGDADLERSLGGGWTVAFALAHLAFWDARQVAALQRFGRGEAFPAEDLATNAALEAIADAFDPDTIGQAAVSAAQQLDAVFETLTAEQVDALTGSGKTYAIERAPHRNEHMRQIEDVVG
ncbi:MAG: DinB family protein [Chloroflexota bacterium]|nr:DinB family protein [Chloroflexota bacterium]